ncbi:tail fiber protein [Pontibacter sp. G13]|uniref:phage tail protein n=1 Tax=Pontibacter sp. G13 TaxID=3074898 RepID=UPI00288B2535|nr:tail fiber protein [Pontibacter sp. G13]WNJ17016.1 tail fiber protein [Pontibacter sp. G13]
MEQYLAEIRMFAGNFAPQGWALCQGQLLQIASFQALYSLLGTQYGGDGRTTFGLPDLRSRFPIHFGCADFGGCYDLAEKGGEEFQTITEAQLPNHDHVWAPKANNQAGTNADPTGRYLANTLPVDPEYSDIQNTQMAADTTGSTGGSQPLDIRQPYLTINYIISTTGVYPSRS